MDAIDIVNETPQIGDVYYESWGYDQTNVDFCQVVKISPSGKTVICRMMGKQRVTPVTVQPIEQYGIEFRLKIDVWIDKYDGRYRGTYLRGSYPFIQQRQDPRPEDNFDKFRHYGKSPNGESYELDFRGPVSFSKYDKPVYETPYGMGH